MPQPPDGYWEDTLYFDPRVRPAVVAPLRRLAQRSALRFRRARAGLRSLHGVTEQVVFMGPPWKWVWMYEVGGRKVAYLHPMQSGVSATFVVTRHEAPHFERAGLPEDALRAYDDGVASASMRLCWINLDNLTAVAALLAAVELKHQLLATVG